MTKSSAHGTIGGGKYKNALMSLLIERSLIFRKIPLYAVNQDIDKIMRRLV
nr:hypothetical protein [Prevotella sp.]